MSNHCRLKIASWRWSEAVRTVGEVIRHNGDCCDMGWLSLIGALRWYNALLLLVRADWVTSGRICQCFRWTKTVRPVRIHRTIPCSLQITWDCCGEIYLLIIYGSYSDIANTCILIQYDPRMNVYRSIRLKIENFFRVTITTNPGIGLATTRKKQLPPVSFLSVYYYHFLSTPLDMETYTRVHTWDVSPAITFQTTLEENCILE